MGWSKSWFLTLRKRFGDTLLFLPHIHWKAQSRSCEQACFLRAMASLSISVIMTEDVRLLGLWAVPLVLVGCVFSRFLQPGFLPRVSTETLAPLLWFGWNQEELNLAWWPISQMPSFHRTSGFFFCFPEQDPWSCSQALLPTWLLLPSSQSLSLGGRSRLIAPYWYLRIWTHSTPFSARWGINLKVSVVETKRLAVSLLSKI